MFDNKKNNKSRLVIDKFHVQSHFDGYMEHKSKSIKVEPPLKNNFIDNLFYYNLFDALNGLSDSIDSKVENINADVYYPGLIKINGDISGTGTSVRVLKIKGQDVANTVLTTGNVLRWAGSNWAFSANQPVGTAGGNLSGSYPNPNVTNLTIENQERGSLLFYDGYGWEVVSPGFAGSIFKCNGTLQIPSWQSNEGTPGGLAGGDLTGTYPNPQVGVLRPEAIVDIPEKTILGNVTEITNNVDSIYLSNGIEYNNFSIGSFNRIGLNNLSNMTVEEHFLNSNLIFYKQLYTEASGTVNLIQDAYAIGTALLSVGASVSSKITIGTNKICKLTGKEHFVCRFALSDAIISSDFFGCIFGFFDGYKFTDINNSMYLSITKASPIIYITAHLIKENISHNNTFLSVPLSIDTYYTISIENFTDKIIYQLYDQNNILLYQYEYFYGLTASVQMPSVLMHSGVSLTNFTTVARDIVYIDYIGVTTK